MIPTEEKIDTLENNIKISKDSNTEELSNWNDAMVMKYHKDGTLFESKNPLLRYVETLRLKTIIKMAELSEQDSVLDLGCGEGFLLTMLPKVQKITGMDISKVALKRAEIILARNNINATLKHVNAQEFTTEEKFDRIVCSEVLEHVPDPEKVIANIYNALKPQGFAVVSVPDEYRIQSIMELIKTLRISKFLHAARKQEDYEWHIHEASVPFLRRICRGYFEVTQVKKVPPILRHRIVAVLKKI